LLNGRLKQNVDPLPSALFSAHILPPRASTILLDIPNSVPVTDFVANFVNSLGYISASIPVS
jgi:hypothetical protein